MIRTTLLLTLLFFIALEAQNIPQVKQVPVIFPTTAASGNIELQGTLYLPDGPTGPFPGIVLVGGSGPTDRFSTYDLTLLNYDAIPPISPNCGFTEVQGFLFYELALAFAQSGFATLAYDKRSCLVPSCPNFPCALYQHTDCVNITEVTLFDYIEDAKAAVSYLVTRPEVNSERIYLGGHSQAVQVVPYVANSDIPAAKSIKGLMLFSGGGRGVDLVLERQLSSLNARWELAINQYCNGSDLIDQLVISDAKLNIAANSAALQSALENFPKIKSGYFAPYDRVCIVGCETAAFWSSWLNITDPTEIKNQLTQFSSNGGVIYSLNSPTDENVAPDDYTPLLQILGNLNGASINVINGLTHELGPRDYSSGNIVQNVYISVLTWLLLQEGNKVPEDFFQNLNFIKVK
eukprot:TRINITY_DN492_c0_g1_i2.p1 TRINITY_DN492_c0_g1~~TRINITY_DN492_c0_g1_i2.p1  ORF type:complete len:405 (-),score=60.78 TRINITY_DN492_c0_g1_i2:52-1266(-)